MQLNGLLSSLLSPTGGGAAACPTPCARPERPDQSKESDASGVMAQISDMAKSLFAQMKKDGVSAESFDLHLDLAQLGIKIGATGARSMEGHHLTVDLHVDASQSDSQQKLDVSFSLEETYVQASESAKQHEQTRGFVDGLKKLLDALGQGKTDEDSLGGILAQIGRALEAMAQRLQGKQAGDAQQPPQSQQPDQAAQQLGGFELQQRVHIHALHVEQVAVAD